MSETVLIKNGTIVTMAAEGTIENGCILLENGKILKVGHTVDQPENCRVIDAHGGFVMPGIIDAHCHIGVFGSGIGNAGVDGNEENDPITPEMRGLDGIYPLDPEFKKAYEAGVTCVATGPGSANPIGGQFLAMKTKGRTMEQMVIKEPLAMKMAFGENPKSIYGSKRTPSTRMGVAALIREALFKAKEYADKKERAAGNPDKMPAFNMKLEALVPVIKGELLVKAHAHRADDIMTAIRIAEEFDLKMTIEHCSEGHLIPEEFAAKNRIAILGPFTGFPHKNETIHQDEASAGILERAGVKVAIMTDLPGMHEENLIVCAGICHRKGMSEEGALRAVTLHAAQAIGLEDRIGSIEPGKDGDIAVFDKNPVKNLDAACICTLIDGRVVYEK